MNDSGRLALTANARASSRRVVPSCVPRGKTQTACRSPSFASPPSDRKHARGVPPPMRNPRPRRTRPEYAAPSATATAGAAFASTRRGHGRPSASANQPDTTWARRVCVSSGVKKPPLSSSTSGRTAPRSPAARRNLARCRVMAGSAANGSPSSRSPLRRPASGSASMAQAGRKPSSRSRKTSSRARSTDRAPPTTAPPLPRSDTVARSAGGGPSRRSFTAAH